MNSAKPFSVLDMAQEYANNNNMDTSDLFGSQNKPTETPAVQPEETPAVKNIIQVPETKDDGWKPDESLIAGMDELTGPITTYSKDEVKEVEDTELRNIMDDEAMNDSTESMNEMERIKFNIEEAKKRHGISKLQVPEGLKQVELYNAASDTDYKKAQENLDVLLDQIKTLYPEFILEYSDPSKNPANQYNPTDNKIIEIPKNNTVKQDDQVTEEDHAVDISVSSDLADINGKPDSVQVIIDKTNIANVSWNDEDIEKIKKARSIELNIVEGTNVEFSQIEDVKNENILESVLKTYTRSMNDVLAALPASKYRCTFTGLTYVEVLDLNASSELSGLDNELKKWTMCFTHMKNPSIGEWRQYVWYIDPDTKQRVEIPNESFLPEEHDDIEWHKVTKFDDFLMHTSYIDLEFMLWKILCATTLDKEIISIKCPQKMKSGVLCNNQYDWLYRPVELLQVDKIDPQVLEDIKNVMEADSAEKIKSLYNESLLQYDSVVKLNSSGFKVVFGHVSAYTYLNDIYSFIKEIDDMNEDDPTLFVKISNFSMLPSIKGVLIPDPNAEGKYLRFTSATSIYKIIESLDEYDWQTTLQMSAMMLTPYQFYYSINGLVCPRCKRRSNAPITSMQDLLFIVAQSLSMTNVTLKKQ